MSLAPFARELTTHRVVEIPPGLDGAARTRFVNLVSSAVAKQAALANQCETVLKVNGRVEVAGELLLLQHEPVSPANPGAILSAEQRPDINTLWWLTWSLVRALAAGHEQTLVHGGVQLGSVLVDQAGQIKLGDFGLAPAFEAVCGGNARRDVVCEAGPSPDAAGRRLSGSWALLPEDAQREYGWISPYFPHELLEDDEARLNAKSDQFALGAVLFLWATGTHPYGDALDDPSLTMRIRFDPLKLEEERPEWAKVFERRRVNLAGAAEQSVCAWGDLLRRFLSGESAARFGSLAEAEQALEGQVPAAWEKAATAIGGALKLLQDGRPDEFLTRAAPWATDESLPPLWRERLAEHVAAVESQRQVLVRRRELKGLLRQAEKAFDSNELAQARELASQVQAAAESDDTLRAGATDLLHQCDEHESLVRTASVELIREQFKAAREALERDDFGFARLCLNTIVQDPASSAEHRRQAHELLDRIDEAEGQYKRQAGELERAQAEYAQEKRDAAQRRLEALLGEPSVREALAAPARKLLEQIQAEQQMAAEYAQILTTAEEAWQQADLKTLQELVGSIPAALPLREITARRDELAARGEVLRAALEHRRSAEELLSRESAGLALASAKKALAAGDLPVALHHELRELARRASELLESQQKERLERARGELEQARHAYDAADVAGCRTLLEDSLLQIEGLPEDVRAAGTELLERCGRCDQASDRLQQASLCLAADDLDAAEAQLREVQLKGLPAPVVQGAAELQEKIKQARRAQAQRQAEQLRAQLRNAEKQAADGDLDAAEASLKAIEQSPHFTADLQKPLAVVRSVVAAQRQIAHTLNAAETAVERGNWAQARRWLDEGGAADGARVSALPGVLPAWAQPRAAKLRQGIAGLEEKQHEQLVTSVRAALDAAEKKLNDCDSAGARASLEQARPHRAVEPGLAERYVALEALAGQLQEWLPKVQACERALQENRTADAYREAEKLLKEGALPPPVAARAQSVKQKAEARTVARREEITAQLAALDEELNRVGRRAKNFVKRVEVLKSDPLASKDQRAQVAALAERFAALPVPRRSKVPILAAAGAAVAALAAAGWYFYPRAGFPPPASASLSEVMDGAVPSLVTLINTMKQGWGVSEPQVQIQWQPAAGSAEPHSGSGSVALPGTTPVTLALTADYDAVSKGWTLHADRAGQEPQLRQVTVWVRGEFQTRLDSLGKAHETWPQAKELYQKIEAGFREAYSNLGIGLDQMPTLPPEPPPPPPPPPPPVPTQASLIELVQPTRPALATLFANTLKNLGYANEPITLPNAWQGEASRRSQTVEVPIGAEKVPLVVAIQCSAPAEGWKFENAGKDLESIAQKLCAQVQAKLDEGRANKAAWQKAKTLYDALAPDLARVQEELQKLGGNPSGIEFKMPPEPEVEPEKPKYTPPDKTESRDFMAVLNGQNEALGRLTSRAQGDQPVNVEFAPGGAWAQEAGDSPNFTQTVAVKVLGEPVAVTGHYSADSKGLTSCEIAAEALAGLARRAQQRIGEKVTALSTQGDLAEAWKLCDATKKELESLEATLRTDDLEKARTRLPRSPSEVSQKLAEYKCRAGQQTDEKSGYPQALTDEQNRTLVLAYAYPRDPVWDTMEQPAEQRGWLIFYVDAGATDVSDPQAGFAQAESAAKTVGPGRQLPTRQQWTLAALRLYGRPGVSGFLGGRYEWCVNERGQGWVCGGLPIALGKQRPALHPPPKQASEQAVWEWLTDARFAAFVSQPRQYGDGLTAIRTVLPVYPTSP